MITGEELTVGVINGEGIGVLRIIPKNEFYDLNQSMLKEAQYMSILLK